MVQNIVFTKNASEVSIFKLETGKKQPFNFTESHKISTTDILGKPMERLVYACEIGTNTIDVCEGDFIVIGYKPMYLNGQMKQVEYVEAHTIQSIIKNFEAYDEFNGEYVADIEDVFDGTYLPTFRDEPDDEEIRVIEETELNTLFEETNNLSIDELLENEWEQE